MNSEFMKVSVHEACKPQASRHWHRLRLFACLLVPLLTASGCGGNNGPVAETVPVVAASGTLTFRGQPLEHYQVMLFPQNGRPAAGMVDAAGKFVLGTNQPGDGAPAGTHRVAVTWIGPPSTDPGQGVMEFTPPPPPTIKIPDKYANPETSGITVEVPESGTDAIAINLD